MQKLNAHVVIAAPVLYRNEDLDKLHLRYNIPGSVKRSRKWGMTFGQYQGVRAPNLDNAATFKAIGQTVTKKLLGYLEQAKARFPEDMKVAKAWKGRSDDKGQCYCFTYASREEGKGVVFVMINPDSPLTAKAPKELKESDDSDSASKARSSKMNSTPMENRLADRNAKPAINVRRGGPAPKSRGPRPPERSLVLRQARTSAQEGAPFAPKLTGIGVSNSFVEAPRISSPFKAELKLLNSSLAEDLSLQSLARRFKVKGSPKINTQFGHDIAEEAIRLIKTTYPKAFFVPVFDQEGGTLVSGEGKTMQVICKIFNESKRDNESYYIALFTGELTKTTWEKLEPHFLDDEY